MNKLICIKLSLRNDSVFDNTVFLRITSEVIEQQVETIAYVEDYDDVGYDIISKHFLEDNLHYSFSICSYQHAEIHVGENYIYFYALGSELLNTYIFQEEQTRIRQIDIPDYIEQATADMADERDVLLKNLTRGFNFIYDNTNEMSSDFI